MIAPDVHILPRSLRAPCRIPAAGRIRLVFMLAVSLPVLLLAPCPALSQGPAPDLPFRRISPEDGLSQSVVLCMLQDRRGYMWFGTEDGLNRYDGYSFVTYRHDPLDSNSLSSSYIWSIHEDRDGLLWIGTWGGGINSLDPDRGRVVRYQYDPSDSTTLSHDRVTGITEDSLGTLWACTAGGGLNRFDRAAQRFVRMPRLLDALPPPRRDAQFCMLAGKNSVLWIGTYSLGLLRYDLLRGRVKEYRHDPGNVKSVSDDRITSLCAAGDGDIWVGTWGGGLNLFHTANSTFEHFRTDPRDESSLPGDIVRSLMRDSNDNLWVGTMGAGAARLDSASRRFIRYRHSPFVPTSLSDDVVTAVYQDQGGVIWFGTSSGLSVISPYVQKFPFYGRDLRNPGGFQGKRVFAICQDSLGSVWIGTEDAGLNRFDPRTGTFRHYRHDPADPSSLPHDYVAVLMTDNRGNVWVGTYGGGLARFDRTRNSFRSFAVDPDNPARRLNAYISAIAQDTGGNMWVGTWIAGMYVLSPSGRILKTFANDKQNPGSLPDNDVRCVLRDHTGTMWVGTARGGIGRYDPSSGAFRRYQNVPEDPQSLGSSYVQSIAEDSAGYLWVGTFGGGLSKLDPRTGRCVRYAVQQGLPNDVVYGILFDRAGHLWVSTNNGISCFDPDSVRFRNYTRHDGLQADEFNFNAACAGTDGVLYFGGVNGFNAITPDRIPANPHVPPVVITGFNLFNVPLKSDVPISATGEITLTHSQNFFSFEYAALDYSLPARNTYAYKLDGLDESWVIAGTRRLASYTDVAPGTYVFHVSGANNDGVWNPVGASLRVTVKPPFWQTLWFRILGALLLLGAATAAYKLRVASILKVERMRLNIASDLHDDIGSSLASIAVLADLVRNRMNVPPAAAGHLLDISRAARSTSDALREIVWFINPEHETAANIFDHLEGIAAKMLMGMDHTFRRDDRSATVRLPMQFRRDIVLVFKEVLSNIVHHAGAKNVAVRVGIDGGRFRLTVEDDGRGFDVSAPSSGNGLATMRRRAQQVGGTLDIRSMPGKGTIITMDAKIP
jgi:ligand-binding sensor domain-containing protein/signal transduction histidine kinase